MVTPTSGRRLTTAAAGKHGKFHEFAMSEQGGCAVTLPCKLFLSSGLCCLLAFGEWTKPGWASSPSAAGSAAAREILFNMAHAR